MRSCLGHPTSPPSLFGSSSRAEDSNLGETAFGLPPPIQIEDPFHPFTRNLLRTGDPVLAAVARGWEDDGQSPLILVRSCSVGKLAWRIDWRRWPGAYWLDQRPLDADWADVDHRGRLLIARKGRIYVRDANGERELIDLNPLTFRPLEPPQWATQWP